MQIDYLIIGQGLAGSLLAWELIQRQQKVLIIDNGKENASLVAAGLINPVTGMRFVKSTDVDQLLPSARHYYQQLSLYFQKEFYIEKTMLRLLRNDKELSACQKRQQHPEYQDYLSEIIPTNSKIHSTHGILKQQQTGYLLTQALLTALKNYFISINAYQTTELHYDEIRLSPLLQWQNIKPKQVIFCEGHHANNNPWFAYLPFQPVKGEIITATSTQKIQQNILNYGHWFIPLDTYQFRTGATFDRVNLNTSPTLEAKETLFNSLKGVYPDLSIDCILNQQAGIRPTTQDKQPFIGHHPNHYNLSIFNGFGAKGSLQIPWYCQRFVDNLLNNSPIPNAGDILRYTSKVDNP